jgi:septin family protein
MQFLAGVDCILNSLVLWVWLIDDDDYSDFEYIHFCLFRNLNGLDSDVEDYYDNYR